LIILRKGSGKQDLMEIEIREASLSDHAALSSLFKEVDALHREHLPHLFREADGVARDLPYYSSLLADENFVFFVAEVEGDLVGLANGVIRDAPAISLLVPRRYMIVDTLVVASEFRGHGIAQMLMDKLQEWAIEKGATSMELTVYEFNESAIAFYQKLGYQNLSRKMSKLLDHRKP
jgi:ribosomal protein S18 acetylase RimI-like enzyme